MLVIQVLVFPVDLNFGRISPIFFTGANNISYLCMNLGTTRAQNYNYIAEKVGILEHMLMHMHGWSVGGNFCPHAAESVGPIICTLLQTDNHATTSSLRPDAVPDTQPTVSKHWRHHIQLNYVLELLEAAPDALKENFGGKFEKVYFQVRCPSHHPTKSVNVKPPKL